MIPSVLLYFTRISQSGSTFLQTLTASFTISSKRASSPSMVIFWAIKLTEAAVTPSIFWTAASILAAQLAQSRSTSLNVFFIFNTPQNF